MKVAVMTDSSCSQYHFNTPNLFILPLMISDQQNEQEYHDNSLKHREFFMKLRAGGLKTSQTPANVITNTLTDALSEYDHVIYCGIFSMLSGQNNFVRLLTESEFRDRVTIIDSGGVSIILDHILEMILDMINHNFTVAEIVERVNKYKFNYDSYILVSDLAPLKHSGRINKIESFISKSLKIGLILRGNDQQLRPIRKFHHQSRAIKMVLKRLKSTIPNLECVDCAFGAVDDKKQTQITKLITKANLKIRHIGNISQAIMCHIGMNSVAICGWQQ